MSSSIKSWLYRFLASSAKLSPDLDDQPCIVGGNYKGSKVKVAMGKVYIIPPFVVRNVHINSKTVDAHKVLSKYELENMRDNQVRGPLGSTIKVPEGIVENIREDHVLIVIAFKNNKQTIIELNKETADLIARNCIY